MVKISPDMLDPYEGGTLQVVNPGRRFRYSGTISRVGVTVDSRDDGGFAVSLDAATEAYDDRPSQDSNQLSWGGATPMYEITVGPNGRLRMAKRDSGEVLSFFRPGDTPNELFARS